MFTRTMLKQLGLEAEMIDTIMDAHVETTDYLKSQITDLQGKVNKYTDYDDIKKELDELKSQPQDDWKTQYDNLKIDFDKYKSSIEDAKARTEKVDGYRNKLINAGVDNRRIDSIIKITDIDGLNLDDVTDESIKENWSDFIVQTEVKPVKIENPIDNLNGGITSEDFKKMSYTERAQIYTENRELYDQLSKH